MFILIMFQNFKLKNYNIIKNLPKMGGFFVFLGGVAKLARQLQ